MMKKELYKELNKEYVLAENGINRDSVVLIGKPSWAGDTWEKIETREYAKANYDHAYENYASGIDCNKYAVDFCDEHGPSETFITEEMAAIRAKENYNRGIVIGCIVTSVLTITGLYFYTVYKKYKKYSKEDERRH